MEENTVDLFDYIRVVWKRKLLIIVVTLVCIGVGVKNSRSKPPPVTSYHADAIVKIGKKVRIMSASNTSSSVVEYIEDPGQLVETVPLKYNIGVIGSPGYHLEVKRIGSLAMLRLIVIGSDKGVERVLKELVDMLVEEHRRLVRDSVVAYKSFMKKLEADAEMIHEDIAVTEVSIKEMRNKEGEYLVSIESSVAEMKEKDAGDRSAFLNMLYLKTIDKERELSNARKDLRNIQWSLIMHKITLGNLEEYNTELVGEIKITAIKPEKGKDPITTISVAGVAGLIMSLFIAFFMEYIEESKARRKWKK